ncbi:MAG: hypothetical protein JNM28_03025 [Armatimonadetes bacterium]|nr:hypothetical protein [Armatimonadota bacterium]
MGAAVSGDYLPGEAEGITKIVTFSDGSTLADRLLAADTPQMNAWIQGQHEDPVPRALLRLLADAVARGEALDAQDAIVFYWLPGRPPTRVYDGPATFAQILGLQIKMYFSDPETQMDMVVDFAP